MNVPIVINIYTEKGIYACRCIYADNNLIIQEVVKRGYTGLHYLKAVCKHERACIGAAYFITSYLKFQGYISRIEQSLVMRALIPGLLFHAGTKIFRK